MEKNLFENAKFGDKFITDDGRRAILLECGEVNCLWIENHKVPLYFYKNGMIDSNFPNDIDIISRYQEPIDEEKLEELSEQNNIGQDKVERALWRTAFKAGYRQAKGLN